MFHPGTEVDSLTLSADAPDAYPIYAGTEVDSIT